MDPARAALRAALLRHLPADEEEAGHRDAMLRLAEGEPRCFARDCYTPGHVTGSAFVLCLETRKVLLHHHRRLDRWLQLGGHDDGELDPARTALREAAEESGLPDVELLSDELLDLDVHAIPAARGEPPHLHHDVRYAAVTRSPDLARAMEAESLRLAWVTLDEAAGLMGESGARRALRRLERYLDRRPC